MWYLTQIIPLYIEVRILIAEEVELISEQGISAWFHIYPLIYSYIVDTWKQYAHLVTIRISQCNTTNNEWEVDVPWLSIIMITLHKSWWYILNLLRITKKNLHPVSRSNKFKVGPMCYLNPFWSVDIIWWHTSTSILAQAMACYLNQCWLLISEIMWHSSERNFTVQAIVLKNAFENYTLKLLPHLRGNNELTITV